MTLTLKETPELTQSGKPSAPSRNPETNPGQTTRSNPVCLEVGITIRSLPNEAGGLTQPIREEGRTVIVFDNGAVIRSTTNLPIGLKVILSNSRGRDVVCQVVGGRNAPNIKGYVEVEFLETVNDFWRIHEDVGPVPAAVLPPAPIDLYETLDSPSSASPFASTPTDAHAKAANESSGKGPSFDDIPGLVSTPIAPAVRQPKNEPAKSGLGLTGNKDGSDYNLSDIADPTSLANWNQSASGSAANRQGIPEKSETEAVSSTKSAAARDFMGQGLMAYEQPSSSAASTSNGKLQLIASAILLVVAVVSGAAFFLRRTATPAPVARTEVQTQPSAPAPSTGNHAAESAPLPQDGAVNSQNQMQLTSASSGALAEAQPAPPATPLPDIILGPATSAKENARSDARATKAPEKKAEAVKQPEAASSPRPAIQNLKMSSPITPKQSGANSGTGAAPLADISSTADAPAATPAGLLTSAGRTSKPPAAPLGEPAPAPAATRIISNPKLLSSTRVAYPPSAKQLKVQGSVSLVLTIDADGNVVAAKPLGGPPLLRQGAADAVKKWKYSPAMQDGKPVPSQVTVSIDFRLE